MESDDSDLPVKKVKHLNRLIRNGQNLTPTLSLSRSQRLTQNSQVWQPDNKQNTITQKEASDHMAKFILNLEKNETTTSTSFYKNNNYLRNDSKNIDLREILNKPSNENLLTRKNNCSKMDENIIDLIIISDCSSEAPTEKQPDINGNQSEKDSLLNLDHITNQSSEQEDKLTSKSESSKKTLENTKLENKIESSSSSENVTKTKRKKKSLNSDNQKKKRFCILSSSNESSKSPSSTKENEKISSDTSETELNFNLIEDINQEERDEIIRKRISTSISSISSKNASISSKKASISTSISSISSKNASISSKKASISSKKASISSKKASISTSISSISSKNASISSKKASISSKNASISSKKASISSKISSISTKTQMNYETGKKDDEISSNNSQINDDDEDVTLLITALNELTEEQEDDLLKSTSSSKKSQTKISNLHDTQSIEYFPENQTPSKISTNEIINFKRNFINCDNKCNANFKIINKPNEIEFFGKLTNSGWDNLQLECKEIDKGFESIILSICQCKFSLQFQIETNDKPLNKIWKYNLNEIEESEQPSTSPPHSLNVLEDACKHNTRQTFTDKLLKRTVSNNRQVEEENSLANLTLCGHDKVKHKNIKFTHVYNKLTSDPSSDSEFNNLTSNNGKDHVISDFGFDSIDESKTRVCFLTHFNKRLLSSLKGTKKTKFVCSELTARILIWYGIAKKQMHIVPLGQVTRIEGSDVTAMDSRFCPGSVMFLVKSQKRKTFLYTGPMRYSHEMEMFPEFWNNSAIDTLYMLKKRLGCSLNTDPKETIEIVFDEKPNKNTLVALVLEPLHGIPFWTELADFLDTKVWASSKFTDIFKLVKDERIDSRLGQVAREAQLHLISSSQLSESFLNKYLHKMMKFRNILVIELEHAQEDLIKINSRIKLLKIPFTEYSSNRERKRFRNYINPTNYCEI